MAGIPVGRENSKPIELHYEDQGFGAPVVLLHGWPLGSDCWERQVMALLDAGMRVITYDRRGFGRSSPAASGYDYDTFAEDLNQLLTVLDLHDVTLVGHGMGAGEVTRYLGTYGSERVSRAVLIAAPPPFEHEEVGNSANLGRPVLDDMRAALAHDRPAFLRDFLERACNFDALGGKLVSPESLQASWFQAIAAPATGMRQSLACWKMDFRDDLPRIDVPTLVIHGDADRVHPLGIAGRPLAAGIDGARLLVIPGAPHNLLWTHAAALNSELIRFLG